MLSTRVLLLLIASSCSARLRKFELTLTWERGSPDGYEREMIFINDQFPGPTLELYQDDWVDIEVANNMPFNTTLHWHGIEQINTPESDGVPGVTQWSIQPGAVFKYRWHAEQYGSYWYHSHSRGQIDDGAYGSIIIRPRRDVANPFHMIDHDEVDWLWLAEAKSRPILLSDWRHRTSSQTLEDQTASGLETSLCMDSLLVNGKGAVDCWSRKDIDQYTSSSLVPLLNAQNISLTNKGCIPPAFYQALRGEKAGINPDVLPPQVYFECTPTTTPHEVIAVSAQKRWASFDIISAASIHTLAFSVDEHPLWIYAVDGHYIEPLKVDSLVVSNGERYSFFVRLDKAVKDYGIRVAALGESQVLDTFAVLSYRNLSNRDRPNNETTFNASSSVTLSSVASINRAGHPTLNDSTTFNQSDMVSFPPQFPQPPSLADKTFELVAGSVINAYTFALNATPFNHHFIDGTRAPLLYQPPDSDVPGGNVTLTTRNGTWVDLIFIVPDALAPPHPIHKHSNKGFLIGSGVGNFTWSTVEEAAAEHPENFNLVNPPYRDTFVTLRTTLEPTWLAVRYQVINPGPFLIHCHIDSHLSGGMAVVVLDGVDEWPDIASFQSQ